ncbi:MAG: hypothetical protein RIS75_963 [Actinomycetota bacterium]
MSKLINSSEWKSLTKHAKRIKKTTLRELFAQDKGRVSQHTFNAAGLTFDFSKHLIDEKVVDCLNKLAKSRDVANGVDRMFSGERINVTENRSVLHTALRKPRGEELLVDGVDVVAQVHEVLDRMAGFADAVRDGRFLGSTGKPIQHVVNIGIGGSDLGPVMAFEALKSYSNRDLSFTFVSNVDGSDISEALIGKNPETTLFIVASKTFTTTETMTNANTAREWLAHGLGNSFNPAAHFAALSTNLSLVEQFGIAPANVFGFWDWVGGRFSMDSAIGLSTMIAIGPDAFKELLAGFNEMDEYFKSTKPKDNVVYRMALLSIWYRNFFDAQTHAVLPYENYLKRFPAYLQQMLMESNGKSVSIQGKSLNYDTSPVYWGEPGTNGQHSFHQLLHQGTTMVPVDFLVAAKPLHEIGVHQDLLFANVLAQASVLAFGKTAAEVRADGTPENLVHHKVMPGNRPSTLIMYEKLTPRVLGNLVALYEHVTLVQGLIWGVGSFDQWGVELGKTVANSISPALVDGDISKLDSSTAAAVDRYRKMNNRN